MKSNTEVSIKFANEEQYFWLEKEYKNFLQLGADGEFDIVFYLEIKDFIGFGFQNFISDPNIVAHGIPHIMYFGTFKKYYVLVMSKTGPTLHDLWHDANLKLEMNTISEIAIKAVSFVLDFFSRLQ